MKEIEECIYPFDRNDRGLNPQDSGVTEIFGAPQELQKMGRCDGAFKDSMAKNTYVIKRMC